MIRPRHDDDLPLCVAALARVREIDGYPVVWPEDPQRWLTSQDQAAAWVAEVRDVVGGHIALDARDSSLVVTRLFVVPDARGTGVAGALLDVVIAFADRLASPIELHVERGSTAAIALYERGGWVRTGSHDGGWAFPDGRRAVEYRYVPARTR